MYIYTAPEFNDTEVVQMKFRTNHIDSELSINDRIIQWANHLSVTLDSHQLQQEVIFEL